MSFVDPIQPEPFYNDPPPPTEPPVSPSGGTPADTNNTNLLIAFNESIEALNNIAKELQYIKQVNQACCGASGGVEIVGNAQLAPAQLNAKCKRANALYDGVVAVLEKYRDTVVIPYFDVTIESLMNAGAQSVGGLATLATTGIVSLIDGPLPFADALAAPVAGFAVFAAFHEFSIQDVLDDLNAHHSEVVTSLYDANNKFSIQNAFQAHIQESLSNRLLVAAIVDMTRAVAFLMSAKVDDYTPPNPVVCGAVTGTANTCGLSVSGQAIASGSYDSTHSLGPDVDTLELQSEYKHSITINSISMDIPSLTVSTCNGGTPVYDNFAVTQSILPLTVTGWKFFFSGNINETTPFNITITVEII